MKGNSVMLPIPATLESICVRNALVVWLELHEKYPNKKKCETGPLTFWQPGGVNIQGTAWLTFQCKKGKGGEEKGNGFV